MQMLSKTIDLGPGLKFASFKEGREHFKQILDATRVGQQIPHQHFDAVKILFETYCTNTNWSLPSPPVAFDAMVEEFNPKCFSVEFADGRRNHFSLDKALSSVAK
jgi:hypothetical protein